MLKTLPPYLKPQDHVILLAPAGCVSSEPVHYAAKVLEQWGLRVELASNVFAQHARFAGTNSERLSDLQRALDDENIRAIFCVRGGYGCTRLLPKLDFEGVRRAPKWCIGFSDITALHAGLLHVGCASIHGPMPVFFQHEGAEKALKSLRKLLFGEPHALTSPKQKGQQTGTTKGQLVGGNLSLLATLHGSAWGVDFKEKIVILEEVGEAIYALERMWWKFLPQVSEIRGLVLGGFTGLREKRKDFDREVYEIFKENLPENIPVAVNFPFGHFGENYPVVMGGEYQLTVNATSGSSLHPLF